MHRSAPTLQLLPISALGEAAQETHEAHRGTEGKTTDLGGQ